MKSRLFVAFVLLVASTVSFGGITYVPANNSSTGVGYLTIESYQLQNNDGNVVLLVRFKPDGWVSTNCAASDSLRMFTHVDVPNSLLLQMLHASVVAAMAQGQRVQVGYDDLVCNAWVGRSLKSISPESTSN